MEPLVVLLLVFVVALATEHLRGRRDEAADRAGRSALAAMFVFTGVSHFAFTAPMVEMLPPSVPAREALVWGTGVLEILGGVGLLVARTRYLAGWCLVAFLVLVFPANIYAALHHTGMGGHTSGPEYLYFRAPLQAFFVAWTVYFAIRRPAALRTDLGARSTSA